MRVERLFSILIYILHHKRVTATELASHFEVTTRTIYRDLELLEQSGIPIISYTGRDGGYELVDSFAMTKFTFTDEERKLILAGLGLQQSHIDNKKIEQLMQKIDLLMVDDSTVEVPYVYKQVLQQHELLQRELRTSNQIIETAIAEKNTLSFSYVAQDGRRTERSVYPKYLQYSYASWYLIGYCTDRQAIRQFKITRMFDVKRTNAKIPDEFIFPEEQIFEQYKVGQVKGDEVLLQFSSELLGFVLDYVPKEWLEQVEDVFFTIRIPEVNLDAFVYHPLLYFDSAQILQPLSLKESFRKLLEKKLNHDI